MTERRPHLAPVPPLAPEERPLESLEDEALMTLVQGDHRGAFAALAARHLPRVARFCAKFLGSARAGEEVAQEVLLATWSRRRGYRSQGRFAVFLFTLARNRCRNHARAERRRRWWTRRADEVSGATAGGSTAPGPLEALLEEERRRQVMRALLALPADLREALLLRFDQQLPYEEIGRVASCPEGTARSRVFLAIRRLRAALGEDEP